MKKLITITTFVLFFYNVYSQVSIGKSKSPFNLYTSNHSSEVFSRLQKTTTYFVIPNRIQSDEFKKIINEVWTFNEFKFISEDDFENARESLISTNISIMKLVDRVWKKEKTTIYSDQPDYVRITRENIEFSFRLTTYKNIKKTNKNKLKYDAYNIAEIFLHPI